MTPKELGKYGAAVAKDVAFDAVSALWRKRRGDKNWSQKKAAETIGADEGWYSKQFNGPRNWTMESFGALVQSLDGMIEIIVRPMEDASPTVGLNNYDAYAEMEELRPKTPKQWNPAVETRSSRTDGTFKSDLKFEKL